MEKISLFETATQTENNRSRTVLYHPAVVYHHRLNDFFTKFSSLSLSHFLSVTCSSGDSQRIPQQSAVSGEAGYRHFRSRHDSDLGVHPVVDSLVLVLLHSICTTGSWTGATVKAQDQGGCGWGRYWRVIGGVFPARIGWRRRGYRGVRQSRQAGRQD